MSEATETKLIKVAGHGNASQLMVVGDYPDEKELKSGRAFEGSYSGTLLKELLTANKHSYNQTWKTCVIKGEVDKEALRLFLKNKKRKQPFEQEGMDKYKEILLEEVKKLRPKVIVAAGEIPLNFLTGDYGIQQFAGSVCPVRNEVQVKTGLYTSLVIPILHPRQLNQQYNMRFPTRFFLGKAVRYLRERYIDPMVKAKVWVAKRSGDLRDFFNRQAHKAKYYTSDIETFQGFPTCIGFCFDGVEAVSVPLLDWKIPKEERIKMLRLVLKVLASKTPCVNQNIDYDQHVLDYFGIRIENIYDDTMILAHSTYPELPKNLAFLASLHTEFPYYKDEGKEFDPAKHESDQLYLYNAKDCLITWHVYASQVRDAKEIQVWPGYTVYDFHREKVWPTYHIYRDMEKTGIRIDAAQRQVLFTKYATYLEVYKEVIETAIGEKYNYNSPDQAATILYDVLKLPKQYAMRKRPDGTRKRTLSADEKAIEELLLNHIPKQPNWTDQQVKDASDLLRYMGLCRKIHKALQFLAVPEYPDGKMRTHVKITGTESGRTSGSETIDFLWEVVKGEPVKVNRGYSFQTVPKHGERLPDGSKFLHDLTTIFIPDDGYVFVEGDKSQAEARVVCVLANDYDQLDLFDSSDIHLVTTSWIVEIPLDELTRMSKADEKIFFQGKPWAVKEMRQAMGKPARHGGNFDMGENEISHQYHIPNDFAKMIIQKFHDAAPNIRNVFHAGVRKAIDTERCLTGPYGRRRDFFDRITNQLYKAAYSFIPQETVSDHVKFDILTPMWKRYRSEGIFFLNERHDSLLLSVPRERVVEIGEAFVQYGATPIDFSRGTFQRSKPLVIPTDLNWSETSWKEMREWKEWKQ